MRHWQRKNEGSCKFECKGEKELRESVFKFKLSGRNFSEHFLQRKKKKENWWEIGHKHGKNKK
jgi:hypothetical protein